MYYEPKESGKRIKELRKSMNLTQEQLANEMRMSRESIGRIETGARGISIDQLVVFAEFFHVSTDFILLGKKDDSLVGVLEGIPEEKRELALKILKGILENI